MEIRKCEIQVQRISDTDKNYEYVLKTNFKIPESEQLEIIELSKARRGTTEEYAIFEKLYEKFKVVGGFFTDKSFAEILDLNIRQFIQYQKLHKAFSKYTESILTSSLTKQDIINNGWVLKDDHRFSAYIFKKLDFTICVNEQPDKIEHLLLTKRCAEEAKVLNGISVLHGISGETVIYNGKVDSLEQFEILMEMAKI